VSFSWKELYDLAVSLKNNPIGLVSKETNFRSAISRAYYAAHGSAKVYVVSKGLIPAIPRDHKAHFAVIEALKKSGNKLLYSMGNELQRLMLERGKADYEDEFLGIEKAVELNVRRCQQIISQMKI
jgi:uncharacterized protein (UPF0332 family)